MMASPSAMPLRCGLVALTLVAAGLAFRLQRYGEQGGDEQRAPKLDLSDGRLRQDPGEEELREARLREYCHPPVGLGAEGRPARTGLELRAVVLTIRHGDRSAIHSVPGSLPQRGRGFSCEAGNLQATMSGLSRRYRIVSAGTSKPLQRPFASPAKTCAPGQLTSRGFRQHLALGSHLQEAYRPFVSQLEDSRGALYVRSTDYGRTVASAAALLTSLLPQRFWQQRIDVVVNENEGAEVMHGVGTKRSRSSGAGDGGTERARGGSCPAAVRHSAAQFDAYQRPEAEFRQLRALFGDVVLNRSVTDFADAMFAANCHGLPLPCGPGGCADHRLAGVLAQRADEHYCSRFAGAEGGSRATQLSFYPFMREVLDFLEAAALDAAPPALALFSGHDTVIAPVLSALGVYRGRLCRWPAYASRIALELYRSPRTGGRPADHYVRVLFNGEAMVGMRGCGAKELCPLQDFARGVASLLGGASDWESACAA